MKLRAQSVSALFLLIACLSTKVEGQVFGNAPESGTAFGIVTYNGLSMSGGAVGFTPTANIDLSSVSLWLSGYSGGQTINVSIWSSSPVGGYNPGTASIFPWAPIVSLNSVSHNNGSLAEFTFSDPKDTTLSANTEYWVVVTSSEPGNSLNAASWVNGGTPTGEAIFDGADSYNIYGGAFDASSALPAFSINSDSGSSLIPVPEPSSMTLISIPLLFGMGRLLYGRWKSNSEALKMVREKATTHRKSRV